MLHEQLVSDRDSVADKEKNALFKKYAEKFGYTY